MVLFFKFSFYFIVGLLRGEEDGCVQSAGLRAQQGKQMTPSSEICSLQSTMGLQCPLPNQWERGTFGDLKAFCNSSWHILWSTLCLEIYMPSVDNKQLVAHRA